MFSLICFLLGLHSCVTYHIGSQPAVLLRSEEQANQLKFKELHISNDSASLPEGLLYHLDYQDDYQLQPLINRNIRGLSGFYAFAATRLLSSSRILSHMSALKPGCTAFVCRSPEGDVLYARNFDFTFNGPAPIVITETDGTVSISAMSLAGYRQHQLSDSTTDASLLAVAPYLLMDGMNSHGLAVSVLYLDPMDSVSGKWIGGTKQHERHKHTLMTTSAMRLLLDRTTSVDDAIDTLRAYNIYANGRKPAGSYHFLLADSSGKSVVIEYLPVLEMRNHKDSIHYCRNKSWKMNVISTDLVTNFYLSAPLFGIGHGFDRYLAVDSVLHPQMINLNTEEKASSSVVTISENEAMNILQLVSQQPGNRQTSNTQWSVVYNLTRKTYLIAVGRRYDILYRAELK